MLIPGERRQELQRGKNAVIVVPQASGVWAPELGLVENHCVATSLMSSQRLFLFYFSILQASGASSFETVITWQYLAHILPLPICC